MRLGSEIRSENISAEMRYMLKWGTYWDTETRKMFTQGKSTACANTCTEMMLECGVLKYIFVETVVKWGTCWAEDML